MRMQRSIMLAMLVYGWLRLMPVASAEAADAVTPFAVPGGISLNEALSLAAENRQELKDLQADVTAADTRLTQAGLPPNPELGVEIDNLGGSLPEDEVRETTLSLSQTLETGGKAQARKRKAQAELQRLTQERHTVWLDIAAEVRLAYLEVLAARERLTLQREAEEIAQGLSVIARERVAAGDLAATEETRAEARWAETRVETLRQQRLMAEAEANLAAGIASPASSAVGAADHLPQELPIPDRQTVLAQAAVAPLLALRRSETLLAESHLALERANAWSDPSLSLGLREISAKDARAVQVGVSIPLPIFQRNQTALAEAGALERKAATRQASTELRLRADLLKAQAALAAAAHEARTLQAEVLSRSQEAVASVQEGFRAGKFRYSDVLEASQSQMTVKNRHLEAVLDLNRAAITLDRLLGRPGRPEETSPPSLTSLHRSQP